MQNAEINKHMWGTIFEENNGDWIITDLPMSQNTDFKIKMKTRDYNGIQRSYKCIIKSKWIMRKWEIDKYKVGYDLK